MLLLRWSRLAQQFIDFIERVTAEGAEAPCTDICLMSIPSRYLTGSILRGLLVS